MPMLLLPDLLGFNEATSKEVLRCCDADHQGGSDRCEARARNHVAS